MSTHTDEVTYLLDRAATLDAAVQALAMALEAPSQSPRFVLKGIVYKSLSERPGFTVTLHGVTLQSVYEQVLDRSGNCPELFGRIHLCLPDDGGTAGDVVISLLIADTGDYSDDGTTHWAYSTYDESGRPQRNQPLPALAGHRTSRASRAAGAAACCDDHIVERRSGQSSGTSGCTACGLKP
ncbi:hypothetical protein [Paraburkholderia bryophila]|uniref:Uncharacterized protein n=1 Tax=Paraburkholderia bryophila TaxID=420952 RepID=A0A7Y9WGR3_9BURK|nr:hypothetical protein [Paraburkholderia bryophila]NYH19948.1 hypothetical protein [Paraburkholderia bryophila]